MSSSTTDPLDVIHPMEFHYVNYLLWEKLEAREEMSAGAKLNEYCQRMRLPKLAYTDLSSDALGRYPQWTLFAQLGHLSATGQGSSEKDARRRTAENLWYFLNGQPVCSSV